MSELFKVYVVNDAYRLAPWAHSLYACDYEWWRHHKPVFSGEKGTLNPRASREYGIKLYEYSKEMWSKKPGALATGSNSGFQALNLAELEGAERIILLGYDMQAKDKKHFFGDHPSGLDRQSEYERWVKKMHEAAPLITAKVINCSRESAIKCFPRMPLSEAI